MTTQIIDPADLRQLKFTSSTVGVNELLMDPKWYLIQISPEGKFLLGCLTPASPEEAKD